MPTTTRSAGTGGPSPACTARHLAVLAEDRRGRRVEKDRRPPAAMELEKVDRDLGRHRASHQAVGRLDDGDGAAEGARGAGELEADEAAADDDHRLRRLEALMHGADVGRVAEIEDAAEIDAGNPRHPRPARPSRRQGGRMEHRRRH